MNNYRIVDKAGSISIQIEVERTRKVGIWPFRKDEVYKEWGCVNMCGHWYIGGRFGFIPPMRPLKSEQEAREVIERWNTPVKYIYP